MPIVLVDEQHLAELTVTADEVRQKLASGKFVWVDVKEPTPDDEAALVSGIGMTSDAAAEAIRMHQRPRIVNVQEGLAMLVMYALGEIGEDPVEVHMIISTEFVVTIHTSKVSALETVQAHCRIPAHYAEATPLVVAHQVIDSVADGYFPRLSQLDDQIDDVEEEIFANPTDEQLQTLFTMKRELIAMRKVVTPMRDMLGAVFTGVVDLPGFSTDSPGWLQDAYDHTIRISDLVDSYRDLLSGAMDVYLSTVSNRLNAVMKQLTVIATIFLPLSFITGFFGQNFLFLTSHIQSTWTFWVFAIGAELAVVFGMLALFRRRKWL